MFCLPADAVLNSNLGIPLRGAAIGNGWIDPRRQYPAYIDFAVKVGLLEENSDVRVIVLFWVVCWLIIQQAWKDAKKLTDECTTEMDKIKNFEPISISKCERLVVDVVKNQNKK